MLITKCIAEEEGADVSVASAVCPNFCISEERKPHNLEHKFDYNAYIAIGYCTISRPTNMRTDAILALCSKAVHCPSLRAFSRLRPIANCKAMSCNRSGYLRLLHVPDFRPAPLISSRLTLLYLPSLSHFLQPSKLFCTSFSNSAPL